MTNTQQKSENDQKMLLSFWNLYAEQIEVVKKTEKKRYDALRKNLNDELALMATRMSYMDQYVNLLEAGGASSATIGAAKLQVEMGYMQQAQRLLRAARSPLLSPNERAGIKLGALQAQTNALNVFKQERDALKKLGEELTEAVSDPTFYLGQQLEASHRSIDALREADERQTAAMRKSIDQYEDAMDRWFGTQPITGSPWAMAKAQKALEIAGRMPPLQMSAYGGAYAGQVSVEQLRNIVAASPAVQAQAGGAMYGMPWEEIMQSARQYQQERIVSPNVAAAQQQLAWAEQWAQTREAEVNQSQRVIQAKIDEANASKALAEFLDKVTAYLEARTGLTRLGKNAGPQPPGVAEGVQAMSWALMQGVYAASNARAYEESRVGTLAGVGQGSSMGRQ